MRKICIINQKGGVGKTTTAINIAAGLAIQGKKVLLIDMDPQGHVAKFFPIREYKKDTYEFLTNGAEVPECAINVGTNLDIITSSPNMRGAEFALMQREEPTLLLSKKLSNVPNYDYIIIDSPPSTGIVVQNALQFVNEIFIPVATEPLAVDGLEKMIKTVEDFQEHSGHKIKVTKIIPTMLDRRNKICKQVLNELQNSYYELLSQPIRVNSKLKEAPRHKKSIFTYAPRSAGAKDYEALVSNIIADEQQVAAQEKSGVSEFKEKADAHAM
ncbi:MAG: ParA family protein [archaeon]